MTEELNENSGEKNWKEMREQNDFLKGKIAEYEAKERQQVFQQAGLDTTKGVGKAVEMMYEGELSVEGIQAYASEEFQVEFGQQDGLQNTVQSTEQSQNRLNNIQKNQVVDNFNTDVRSQIRNIEQKGTPKQSIAAKLSVLEEGKNNLR
jgi:hypothetical protein